MSQTDGWYGGEMRVDFCLFLSERTSKVTVCSKGTTSPLFSLS